MIGSFKQAELERFYRDDRRHRSIPASLEGGLYRKLQLIDASITEADLRVPPGNRFEHLEGEWKGWCSIRVNKQYRLIFQWDSKRGEAHLLFLDAHEY